MQKNKLKSAANFTPLRFGLLCVAILCCMGLLLARVGWLQIVSPDNLVKQEDMRSLREEPIDVQRGMISDREGRPLAVSVPVSAIWIDPQTTLAKGGVGYGPRWQAMAQALHLNLSELAHRVEAHPHARFLYLARQINPEQAEWIDKLHLPGINLRDESRRFYPAGHVAAN
ncbi:peptidoglycan synthase, partial [Klebsiella michiganensis]